jgi:hypothetical protein
MNTKIKNHLLAYSESKGYGITDEDLMKIIVEAYPIVCEGKRDEHRWYDMIPTVVNINGMLLQYNRCSVKGEESSVEDCIGGYKLDDVIEVKPIIKPITVYEPVTD